MEQNTYLDAKLVSEMVLNLFKSCGYNLLV